MSQVRAMPKLIKKVTVKVTKKITKKVNKKSVMVNNKNYTYFHELLKETKNERENQYSNTGIIYTIDNYIYI